MALTVNSSFQKFNQDYVNLASERTTTARNSRDWLIKQLESLPGKVDNFPRLFDGMHIRYGSFARNTKIKPLDDIDIILCFAADGTTYNTVKYGEEYYLQVPASATNLKKLTDDNGRLNSIKLINHIVSGLSKIENYKAADIHRRQEAATLKLSSYEWNFDIVPALYTDTGYYLIPDGKGNWKATDPRIDQQRTTEVNQKHKGQILQIIRILKYWNRRASMPTIPSYLFENIILCYFDSKTDINEYIDVNLIYFWDHLKNAIYYSVPDPKGFQKDLNTLSFDDMNKIAIKSGEVYLKGYEAYKIETEEKNQQKAINKWREIFGIDFPQYG